jgi:catalase
MKQDDTNTRKDDDLEHKDHLTTNQGVKINNTDDSLTAGSRGPTLMEDFHFREKLTHFDHERIPERIVHARGSAAHGVFRVYDDSMKKYTKAKFLTDPSLETPVFVRFSTVVGFRGSADTVRDVRGFATKFYTVEGNYDLVGNNMPVFFIQDGIKFPDLVHAIKPEPHNEMPQASAAHDTFWDFISLMPESMHMIMWVLSDRALPRSYSMMEGFGVHTFKLINDSGEAHFVKFHWKPVAGVYSVTWDETQKIAGADPDFNRRDLWESIEMGNYPEYELGVQIINESEEFDFDFDILDATKLWPEEIVPVKKIGKMMLNRNPDNFFAETEQVAFHPGNLIPGIDVTNDPLLQARLFSYLDTQLIRLGGPNFSEIPINRPHVEVSNNQRDGHMRQTVNKGRVSYSPNSLADGKPMTTPKSEGGYVHYNEKVEGTKIRERSSSFKDHFSQATLFYNSQSETGKKHILEAFEFELGKVETMDVRERMVELIANIDIELAKNVAMRINVEYTSIGIIEKAVDIAENVKDALSKDKKNKSADMSPALNQENLRSDSLKGRKVAVLMAEGFNESDYMSFKNHMDKLGVRTIVVSKMLGDIKGSGSNKVSPDKSFVTTSSVLYDGLFVPGGDEHIQALSKQGDAIHMINEVFKHCKSIGFMGEAVNLLEVTDLKGIERVSSGGVNTNMGVVSSTDSGNITDFNTMFENALRQYRHWEREDYIEEVPA